MAKDEQYRRGYAAGYADGVRDAAESRVSVVQNLDIAGYPVKGMEISQRAINCLVSAGCVTVLDVMELSDYHIATMRNLGKITAHEIACWMIENGIMHTAWSNYL